MEGAQKRRREETDDGGEEAGIEGAAKRARLDADEKDTGVGADAQDGSMMSLETKLKERAVLPSDPADRLGLILHRVADAGYLQDVLPANRVVKSIYLDEDLWTRLPLSDPRASLMKAILRGRLERVKVLIKDKPVKELLKGTLTDQGHNALTLACDAGHSEIALLLIDAGCDVTAATVWNRKIANHPFYGHPAEMTGRATCLDYACARGLENVVDKLIEKGAVVNPEKPEHLISEGDQGIAAHLRRRTYLYSSTPLVLAIANGHEQPATTFIEKYGADVTLEGSFGLSPLQWAAYNGEESLIGLMLGKVAPISAGADAAGGSVETLQQQRQKAVTDFLATFETSHPLLLAAAKSHVGVMRLLIEAGADAHIKEPWSSTTPLHAACFGGHKEAVAYLLQECKVDVRSVDVYERDAFDFLANRFLFYNSKDHPLGPYQPDAPSAFHHRPLWMAEVSPGYQHQSPTIPIARYARSFAESEEHLFIGARSSEPTCFFPNEQGRIETLQVLTKNTPVDVSSRDDENDCIALTIAIRSGFVQLAEQLLKSGRASPDDVDYALQVATRKGHVDLANKLIVAGANIARTDEYFETFDTSLALAVDGDYEDLALQMLKAQPEEWRSVLESEQQLFKGGYYPGRSLHRCFAVACEKGLERFCLYLLDTAEGTLDVNATDDQGLSALHHACAGTYGRPVTNMVRVVSKLLDRGADVDAETDGSLGDVSTPLLCAISQHSNDDVALELLRRGANPQYCCPLTESTALRSAVQHNKLAVVKALVETYKVPLSGSPFEEALRTACKQGYEELALYLFDARASPVTGLLIAQLLRYSAQHGLDAMVFRLLGLKESFSSGFVLLSSTASGLHSAALLEALTAGRESTTMLLVGDGADLSLPVSKGQLPWEIAQQAGHTNLADKLRRLTEVQKKAKKFEDGAPQAEDGISFSFFQFVAQGQSQQQGDMLR
jgi:ankyrin repeat protein